MLLLLLCFSLKCTAKNVEGNYEGVSLLMVENLFICWAKEKLPWKKSLYIWEVPDGPVWELR